MANILVLTNRPLGSGPLQRLKRNGATIKVLHLFEPVAGEEELGLINDLRWAERVVVDDELFDNVRGFIRIPCEKLSRYAPPPPPLSPEIAQRTSPDGTVLFVPCNDTHVRMFLPVAKRLPERHFLVIRGENADKYLDEHNEPYQRMDLGVFRGMGYGRAVRDVIAEHKIRAIVFANDWVGENWRICEVARGLGVPTVCIQEGPQDYELDGGKWRQMQFAEYIFSQGLITLQYLSADEFYVSGNPRLSFYTPQPLPDQPKVMINSNFTYGVYEDWRDRWVADCVGACGALGLPYFISQHPRDNGVFTEYTVIKSDAFKIPDQINSANVIVTRFSQVVYEAMLSGRQVVYYNPHGEVKKVLTEDRSGGFYLAHDRDSLAAALREAVRKEFPNERERRRCLRLHCGPCDGKEVDRILLGLARVVHAQADKPAGGLWSTITSLFTKGSNVHAKEVEKELKAVVKEHGPFTAQNMRLADGVYTINEKVNYDHFKVNRIKQIVADFGLLRKGARLLDIASLQSMFAIEFAFEGLDVVSVEGRESNLEKGKFAAKVFGLDNIEFYQDDVNNITLEKYGRFDAILCMGILYHIAQNKYLDFLKNLSECTDLLIIDSFIALHQDTYVERDGMRYLGTTWREHDETTTLEQRLKSAHSSLDNAQSFTMTRECLLDYLEKLGFTTVMEAVIPKQPSQPEDRPTLVCRRGSKVSIRVFPEFNYEKDFSSAMDSRGIQGRNVVFWNLPKEGDQKPSFVSLNQNIDPAIRSPRSAATLRVYDHCLDALRASPVNVLELGTREAGSLVLLAKYFPAGNVLGLGVAPLAADAGAALSAEDNKRVKFASGKLADKTFVAGALNSLFGDKAVDIVIDNASHLYKETRDVYEHVFTERLRGGGLYVIEGWGCGYWPKWADGNPDGLHGLPLFIKELVDEVAKVDRTKLYKAERALAVADVQSSTIDHLYIAPGVVVVQKA